MSTEEKKVTKRKTKYSDWVIAISVILVFVTIFLVVWCGIAPNLDPTGLRYLVTNAVASYGGIQSNREVRQFKEKHGWITGVCHPHDTEKDVGLIKEANIGWVRFDLTSVPYTYGENGEKVLTSGYLSFKERASFYAQRGIKVMCVTQYPSVFYAAGYDCRKEEGQAEIKKMAAFIAEDLQGVVGAFQVTNEMGVDHFRDLYKENGKDVMLSYEEATKYIGIQLEAMYPVRKDIPIGYNLAGWTIYTIMDLMKPWHKYCDYVALDLYCGCFENIMTDLLFYDLMLRAIWNYTHKPILLNEFGYIGAGKLKTEEEKAAILRSYGYESEEAARNDVQAFFKKLPASLQEDVLRSDPKDDADLARLLFDTEKASHIYKQIQSDFQLTKYKHTEEDQGRFFLDCINRLSKLKFLCGAIVYCYSDSDRCYVCGQADCPVETGWGLIGSDGNPKASYYAVQEAFGKIVNKK